MGAESVTLAGEVPASLAGELSVLCDRQSWVKKRVLAAAICAFLDLSREQQAAWLETVYQKHYAVMPGDGEGADPADAVDEALEASDRVSRRRARSARRAGGPGQASA